MNIVVSTMPVWAEFLCWMIVVGVVGFVLIGILNALATSPTGCGLLTAVVVGGVIILWVTDQNVDMGIVFAVLVCVGFVGFIVMMERKTHVRRIKW